MLCYSVGFVTGMKIEQRIDLKFLVKLKKKKTPTECFQLLKEVYGDNVMSCMRVFNDINGSWKVARKWKTTNVRDPFQHQKPKKMSRKSVKLLT
jgi:hypothetical protein